MSDSDRAARIRNYLAMSMLAGRMRPNYGAALRHTDPVAYADLVTSMNDRRAGLSIACGVPVGDIDRNGYSPPGAIARAKADAEVRRAAPTITPQPAHVEPRTGPRPVVEVHLPADEGPSDDGLWTRAALLGGEQP